MIYTNVERAGTPKNERNPKGYKSRERLENNKMKKQLTALVFLLLAIPSFGQIKGIQPIYYEAPKAEAQPDVMYKAPYEQIKKNNEIKAQTTYQNQVNANTYQALEREKTVAKMKQVKAYYNSFKYYPKSIPDDWYAVYAMDNYDFCEERIVYVSGNRVTKYVIDLNTERVVLHSHLINNAKATIQIKASDGTTSILDIYFIDYLNNY